MNVTIIGTGRMGRALSAKLLESGHTVSLIEHTPGKAEALVEELMSSKNGGTIEAAKTGSIPGEVVILAVPYGAIVSVIQQYNSQLAGKILIDITNPVNFQTMEPLIQDGSAAEQIARLLPATTRVVKTFNTVFAKTLPAGKVADQPLDVFIAGDDAEAKSKVVQMIEKGGMRAIDAGPLTRSRQLEGMELLHMAIQSTYNMGYQSAIKVLV